MGLYGSLRPPAGDWRGAFAEVQVRGRPDLRCMLDAGWLEGLKGEGGSVRLSFYFDALGDLEAVLYLEPGEEG